MIGRVLSWGFLLLFFAGCCSDSNRFSHVNTEGPAPYVFFDQKTKQVCWGGTDSANEKNVSVTIKVGNATYVETQMPICKDL